MTRSRLTLLFTVSSLLAVALPSSAMWAQKAAKKQDALTTVAYDLRDLINDLKPVGPEWVVHNIFSAIDPKGWNHRMQNHGSIEIVNGNRLLIQATDRWWVLSITPRIYIKEEEDMMRKGGP